MAINVRSYRELSFKDTDKISAAQLADFAASAPEGVVTIDVHRVEHDRYPGQFDTTITLSIEETK